MTWLFSSVFRISLAVAQSKFHLSKENRAKISTAHEAIVILNRLNSDSIRMPPKIEARGIDNAIIERLKAVITPITGAATTCCL